jgi:hypothetical protein
MHKALFTITAALVVTGILGCKSTHPTGATGPHTAAVMAPVHQFVDGFNKGDFKSAVAACADQMSIIDDLPPHEWHGAGALDRWMSDYDTDAKLKGMTDEVVALGEPKHVDVTGDRAYVVVPTTYDYKEHGKAVPQKSAILTVALHKAEGHWLITGWSWAQD